MGVGGGWLLNDGRMDGCVTGLDSALQFILYRTCLFQSYRCRQVLGNRNFPASELHLYASARSAGKKVR